MSKKGGQKSTILENPGKKKMCKKVKKKNDDFFREFPEFRKFRGISGEIADYTPDLAFFWGEIWVIFGGISGNFGEFREIFPPIFPTGNFLHKFSSEIFPQISRARLITAWNCPRQDGDPPGISGENPGENFPGENFFRQVFRKMWRNFGKIFFENFPTQLFHTRFQRGSRKMQEIPGKFPGENFPVGKFPGFRKFPEKFSRRKIFTQIFVTTFIKNYKFTIEYRRKLPAGGNLPDGNFVENFVEKFPAEKIFPTTFPKIVEKFREKFSRKFPDVTFSPSFPARIHENVRNSGKKFRGKFSRREVSRISKISRKVFPQENYRTPFHGNSLRTYADYK